MKNYLGRQASGLAKDQAGVTMIEQIMAVALIGLALVVWFNVIKVQTKGVLVSKNSLRAQNLALTKLEVLRSTAINAGYEGQFRWVTQSPTVIQYGLTNISMIENKSFTWTISTTFVDGFSPVTSTTIKSYPYAVSYASDVVWFMMWVNWSDVTGNLTTGARTLTQAAYVSNPRK